MKKKLNIVMNILTCLMVVVALFAFAITIFSVTSVNDKNDKSKPSLFGYKFYIVLSDSMSATHFHAGDLIVVEEVDVYSLQVGDIITFYSESEGSKGEIVTHQIVEVVVELGNLIGYRTKGASNNGTDGELVHPLYVQGKYIFDIPKLGYFIKFMRTPLAYIIFVAIPFVTLIGHEVYKIIKLVNTDKKEKQQLEKSKQEKLLEEERLKNEQMQREIEELKKRLASENKDSEE